MTSTVRTPYPGVRYPLDDRGAGPVVLLLHGGAGPDSLAELADRLAVDHRVLLPTHPGWGESVRPDWFTGVGRLAELYLELMDDSDLHDVTVLGSSVGGWVAAELTIRDRARRVGRLVLMDAIGLPGLPPAPPRPAPVDGAAPRQGGPSSAVRATLQAYGGDALQDPALPIRLARIRVPTLAVWGEDDPIAPPDYGRAFASVIPGARFVLIAGAGHVPSRERPDAVLEAISERPAVGAVD